MGNQNIQNKIEELPINFKQLKREQHNILGTIRYIENSHQGKNYILIEKIFHSEFQSDKYLKKIKSRQKIGKMQKKYYPNNFIIEVLDYRKQQISEVCGKTFKIFVFLKDFDKDLKKIFNEKLKNKQNFTQNQLLQMILKLVNCLIELYDHQIHPFHLSLQSIVYCNNNYKLIDSDLASCMKPTEELLYKSQLKKGTYLAPQILSALSNRTGDSFFPSSKSDIFTLGMVFLALGSLKELDSYYDYTLMKLNFRELELEIKQLKYQNFFKQLIREMLQRNQHERIGLLRLKEKLKKHNINLTQTNVNEEFNNDKSSQSGSLIYLGNIKTKRSISKDGLSVIIPCRKDSFHPLYNKKRNSVSKRSFRLNPSDFSQKNSQKIIYQSQHQKEFDSRQTYLSKNSYPQLYKAGLFLKYQHVKIGDLSDIRSDVPVSPITYSQVPLMSNAITYDPYVIAKNKYENEKPQKMKAYSFGYQPALNKVEKMYVYQPVYKNFDNFNCQSKKLQNQPINMLNKQKQPKTIQTPRNKKIIKKQDQNKGKTQLLFIKQNTQFIHKKEKQQISPKLQQTPIKQMQLHQTLRKQQIKINQRIYGRYDFSNGAVYEGQFNQQNQFQGNGILYYPSGKIFYSGNWARNMFHGYGILNNVPETVNYQIKQINYKNFILNDNSYWTQYEGEFSQDKKNGFGTLYFINGDKFSGCFQDDFIQGFGSFYQKNKNKPVSGVWNNNIFQQS